MADEARAEALAAELALIAAMYGDEESELRVEALEDGSTIVVVRLRPHSGGEALQRHVDASIQVSLPSNYPEQAASVRLERARGLVEDEEARLLYQVRTCAEESTGEPCLYAVLESAAALLTEINASGICPICRDELFEPANGRNVPPKVFLSACYHSFHVHCLLHWRLVYAKPASKGEAGEGMHTTLAVARANAKAAEAAAGDLQAKTANTQANMETLSERLAKLQAMVDPPAPPASIRKVVEEIEDVTMELSRLKARVNKAEERRMESAAAAEAAVCASQAAAKQEPLPCPVCRTLMTAQSLDAGGVHQTASGCMSQREAASEQPMLPLPAAPNVSLASLTLLTPPAPAQLLPPGPQPPGLPCGLADSMAHAARSRKLGESSSKITERREAPDGNLYSKSEFYEYFGGFDEWDAAAPPATVTAPASWQAQTHGGKRGGGRSGRGRGRAGRGTGAVRFP